MIGVLVVIVGVAIGAGATLGIAGRIDDRRQRYRIAGRRHMADVLNALRNDPDALDTAARIELTLLSLRSGQLVPPQLFLDWHQHVERSMAAWNHDVDPTLVAEAEKAEP